MKNVDEIVSHLKLQFNIDYPDLEECYMDGYECALGQMDDGHNPFKEGSLEAEHWLEGWWDGYYGHAASHQENGTQEAILATGSSANDTTYIPEEMETILFRILKISGAILASAIIGYQIFDMVA